MTNIKKLQKLQKKFCNHFKVETLNKELVLSKENDILLWFKDQDWSEGQDGVWERLLFLDDFPGKKDPFLICRILPLTHMDTDDIPDHHWPFPIQHPLKRILEAGGPLHVQSYVTLFEAMIHLHFVTLASQYYWTMENILASTPELREEDDVFCAYRAIFESLTDDGCMGGNVWTDRAGLLTIASARIREQLPFPELADIMEPADLKYSKSKDKQDRPLVQAFQRWPGRGADAADCEFQE